MIPIKLYAARTKARRMYPYASRIIMAMQIIEEEQVGTMAVDKHWRLYFSPKFVEETPVNKLAVIWIHEYWHIVLKHPERAERMRKSNPRAFNATIWNVAVDATVNGTIRNSDPTHADLLPDGVWPEKFGLPQDGGLGEENYRKLLEQCDENDQPSPGHGAGSGSDGQSREYERPIDGNHGHVSKAEQDQLRKASLKEFSQHKHAGNGSAESMLAVGELEPPKVAWQGELGALVSLSVTRQMGLDDQAYGRQNRRWAELEPDLIMPTLVSCQPRVGVLIDASGSMGCGKGSDLHRACCEIVGILNAFDNVEMKAWSCDVSCYPIGDISNPDDLNKVKGGGGTDIESALNKIIEDGESDIPSTMIILTDCYTPWPSEMPNCIDDIIIVRTGSGGQLPSWADHVLEVGGEQ